MGRDSVLSVADSDTFFILFEVICHSSIMWEPFGRAPENNTAYWKEGPNGRGTFSILSTCLITLSLCVYTSLHLNIPEHGKTYWGHQFWKRAWWVFLGVATPEFVSRVVSSAATEAKHFRLPTSPFVTGFSLVTLMRI